MGWLQLALLLAGLAREIMKWVNQQESDRKKRLEKVKGFTHAIKKAREKKDTSDLEAAIAALGLSGPGVQESGKKLET